MAKWFLRDEQDVQYADRLLDSYLAGSEPLALPRLARYELSNTLLRAVRDDRIDERAADRALQRFAALKIAEVEDPDERIGRALELAFDIGLSLYDALYVALAEELGLEFVTADVDLYERTARFLPLATLITDIPL